MKKLLLTLVILLTFFGCTYKKGKEPKVYSQTAQPGDTSTRRPYIVFMKGAENSWNPLVKSLETDTNQLKNIRNILNSELKNYFKKKEIPVEEKDFFLYLIVGAAVNITPNQVNLLREDTLNVKGVIENIKIDINVDISINPIQQTETILRFDPRRQWLSGTVTQAQINPIQQSPPQLLNFDIDPTTHITRAVSVAGGPVTSPIDSKRMIWFLDTGIDILNPNLRVEKSLGKSFIPGAATADDDNGHGTFCAGIAAGKPVGTATDELQIHYGVSEGAPVVPVKVLDQNGQGDMGNVIRGLEWVAEQIKDSSTNDVVNLSLGAYDIGNYNCYNPGLADVIKSIVEYKGVFVIMAAGNNAGNATLNLPGCIDLNGLYSKRVLTVSSLDSNLSCAQYANFNIGRPAGKPVDYVTVGTRVFSLWAKGEYRMASGTSASCALMAGIIHIRGTQNIFHINSPDFCFGERYKIAKHRN